MPPRRDNDQPKRNEIANLLDKLGEFLVGANVVQDPTPLYKAAGECRNNRPKGRWGYHMERLLFRNLGKLKILQQAFDLQNATLEFSVTVEGVCAYGDRADPLTSLELNIDISGEYLGAASDLKQAFCCWHLDRHGYLQPSEFSHPRYHFSFGGRHLESFLTDKDIAVLLADSPRIPHPPLDAILGVDFIITNFLGASLSKHRADAIYANIVTSMQKSLWKPYIDVLYGHWQPKPQQVSWEPGSIWTQLM